MGQSKPVEFSREGNRVQITLRDFGVGLAVRWTPEAAREAAAVLQALAAECEAAG